jgi:hypothetical protein
MRTFLSGKKRIGKSKGNIKRKGNPYSKRPIYGGGTLINKGEGHPLKKHTITEKVVEPELGLNMRHFSSKIDNRESIPTADELLSIEQYQQGGMLKKKPKQDEIVAVGMQKGGAFKSFTSGLGASFGLSNPYGNAAMRQNKNASLMGMGAGVATRGLLQGFGNLGGMQGIKDGTFAGGMGRRATPQQSPGDAANNLQSMGVKEPANPMITGTLQELPEDVTTLRRQKGGTLYGKMMNEEAPFQKGGTVPMVMKKGGSLLSGMKRGGSYKGMLTGGEPSVDGGEGETDFLSQVEGLHKKQLPREVANVPYAPETIIGSPIDTSRYRDIFGMEDKFTNDVEVDLNTESGKQSNYGAAYNAPIDYIKYADDTFIGPTPDNTDYGTPGSTLVNQEPSSITPRNTRKTPNKLVEKSNELFAKTKEGVKEGVKGNSTKFKKLSKGISPRDASRFRAAVASGIDNIAAMNAISQFKDMPIPEAQKQDLIKANLVDLSQARREVGDTMRGVGEGLKNQLASGAQRAASQAALAGKGVKEKSRLWEQEANVNAMTKNRVAAQNAGIIAQNIGRDLQSQTMRFQRDADVIAQQQEVAKDFGQDIQAMEFGRLQELDKQDANKLALAMSDPRTALYTVDQLSDADMRSMFGMSKESYNNLSGAKKQDAINAFRERTQSTTTKKQTGGRVLAQLRNGGYIH